MDWDTLLHNRHALKIVELIPIRAELVFSNLNMDPFMKLIFTCSTVK